MFDDHMEIRSPGLPPAPVTVESLSRRQGVHLSRNPLIVRALVDMGYMRELGEGIPRMFAEMDRQGFYPPQFSVVGGFLFHISMRNQPVYDRETLAWLSEFEGVELTGDQKRLLVFAKAHEGQFTSRDFQQLVSIGSYEASNQIKDLIRKRVVRQLRKGGKVYQVAHVAPGMGDQPDEYRALSPIIEQQGYVTNQNVRTTLGVERKTAFRVLQRLVEEGWLIPKGQKRGLRYVPAK